MAVSLLGINGQELGYSLVPYPRKDLTPLSVVDRKFEKIGDLSDFLVFPPEVRPPDSIMNERTPELSQVTVNGLDMNMQIGFLKNILQVLNFGKLSIDFNLKNTKKIQLKFHNVSLDEVYPVKIVKYTNAAKPDSSDGIKKLLEYYIQTNLIAGILKSDSFSVTLLDDQGAGAITDISILKDSMYVNQNIKIEQKNDSTIQYDYSEPLTFAALLLPFTDKRSFFGKPITFYPSSIQSKGRDMMSYDSVNTDSVSNRRESSFLLRKIRVDDLKPIILDPEF